MEVQNLDGITFYYYDDIEKELNPEELQEFNNWFAGQTGIIGPYGLGVYTWDWENFLRRNNKKPVFRTGNVFLDEMIRAELEFGD